MTTLTAEQARWSALDAQGLGRPRPAGRVTRQRLLGAIDQMGLLQLDAVNVVERTQYLVPFSRVGGYDRALLEQLWQPGGPLFEYWGHAACVLPLDLHPALRWRMEAYAGHTDRGATSRARMETWVADQAAYIEAVFGEVATKGSLPASALDDPRRRDGEWWGRRSVGRQVLEWLFSSGRLAAWRTPSFERVYDLPGRVLPAEVLAQPTTTREEGQRRLVLRSLRALGVGSAFDVHWYFYVPRRDVEARLGELLEAGEIEQVTVDGWARPAFRLPGTKVRRPTRTEATLLSPFDPLLFNRERLSRLFGFDYTIEIYVPEPKRRYGYYVLPMLLGDRLVGRFDLKADRKAHALLVRASHAEAGVDHGEVAPAALAELDRLRSFLGLETVVIEPKGNLAPALQTGT